MKGLIQAIRDRAHNFTFTEEAAEPGNIRWRVESGAYYSYEFVPLYFYNGLTEFLRSKQYFITNGTSRHCLWRLVLFFMDARAKKA